MLPSPSVWSRDCQRLMTVKCSLIKGLWWGTGSGLWTLDTFCLPKHRLQLRQTSISTLMFLASSRLTLLEQFSHDVPIDISEIFTFFIDIVWGPSIPPPRYFWMQNVHICHIRGFLTMFLNFGGGMFTLLWHHLDWLFGAKNWDSWLGGWVMFL